MRMINQSVALDMSDYTSPVNYIKNVDCMEGMKALPDASVDLIVTDPPYGVTQNEWDVPPNLAELWAEYKRVLKPNGAALIFSDGGRFTAQLLMSNERWWRYNLVWDKVLTSGFLNANRMPLRRHEVICVFYAKQPTYHPQMQEGSPNHSRGKPKVNQNDNYGEYGFVDNSEAQGNKKHPSSILVFPKPHAAIAQHPTQKPTDLLEYLICSYSDPGATVLDTFMGSGSTAVACIKTGRNFIGFEIDEKYHAVAMKRIASAAEN